MKSRWRIAGFLLPLALLAVASPASGKAQCMYDVWARALSTSATIATGPEVQIWNRENSCDYKVRLVSWATNPLRNSTCDGQCDSQNGTTDLTYEVTAGTTSNGQNFQSQLDTCGAGSGSTWCPLAQSVPCDHPLTQDCRGVCVQAWILHAEITYRRPSGTSTWIAVVPPEELPQRADSATGESCYGAPGIASCCQGESCTSSTRCTSSTCTQPGYCQNTPTQACTSQEDCNGPCVTPGASPWCKQESVLVELP